MWLPGLPSLLLLRLLGAAATVAAMAAARSARGLGGGLGGAVPGAEGAQWPIFADPGSGCSCKQTAPAGYLICFDLVSCVRFPSNVTVRPLRDQATLYVRNTRIPALLAGDLARLQHLTELEVGNSHALVRVQPGAFHGMARLANLTLSSNPRLAHLEAGALEGLDGLRQLSLVRNGFLALADVVPALTVAALPGLRVLRLDDNRLRAVAASDFQPMTGSPLEELSLAGCGLVTLHPDGLAPLQRLAALHLANNILLNMTALAASLDHLGALGLGLRTFDLAAIGLAIGRPSASMVADDVDEATDGEGTTASPTTADTTDSPVNAAATAVSSTNNADHSDASTLLLEAIARSQVTELVLRHNEVERLWPGAFPRIPGLRRLDLSHVGLGEGRPGALSVDVVPDLEELDLSHNRLPRLRPGFASHRLLALDLSACKAAYFDLGEGTFLNMSRLEALHLSYCRVLRLTNQSFQGLDNLKVLTMRNASLFRLDDGVFQPLRRLQHLDLQRNLFPTYRPMRADIFLGLGHLRVLLLGGCGMRSLGPDPDVFRHLVSLTQLGLQDNALTSLDGSRSFAPLRALQHVDLSRNRIGSWRSARLFAHNEHLRELRAAGNTLTYLSEAMLRDLEALDVVDLADNTFHCGCDLYRPVRQRIDFGAANLTRLLRNKCLSPDRWRDRAIADYVNWMSTSGQPDCVATAATVSGTASGVTTTTTTTTTTLLVALPLGLLLGLLVGTAVLAYRYRHHIRYYYTVARRRAARAGLGAGEMAAYNNYQYDAFVSYSSEDQEFVRLLVSRLEGEAPHFRLCVYERDFTVGAAITEAVLASVAHSRRVLLVVSPAFARSHWCAWEAHIAHHQRLLADDALLVVRLGDVDEALLTPTLRYLLRTRIYLEWREDDDGDDVGRKAFWRKLRAALAPPVKPAQL